MGYLTEAMEHLKLLARNFHDYDDEYIMQLLLVEIGIPAGRKGYDYTVDAILLYYQTEKRYLTKEIYPAISKKNGIYVRPVQVEGGIRKVVESAYKHRDLVWNCYFPEEKKPTNTEFIARMALILKMWHDCCKMETSGIRRDEY